jgi:hypothetical protein
MLHAQATVRRLDSCPLWQLNGDLSGSPTLNRLQTHLGMPCPHAKVADGSRADPAGDGCRPTAHLARHHQLHSFEMIEIQNSWSEWGGAGDDAESDGQRDPRDEHIIHTTTTTCSRALTPGCEGRPSTPPSRSGHRGASPPRRARHDRLPPASLDSLTTGQKLRQKKKAWGPLGTWIGAVWPIEEGAAASGIRQAGRTPFSDLHSGGERGRTWHKKAEAVSRCIRLASCS